MWYYINLNVYLTYVCSKICTKRDYATPKTVKLRSPGALRIMANALGRGQQVFFCKRPGNKYFRLCGHMISATTT